MGTLSDQQKEEEYEQSHVHDVYNSIASHFSQTRYKPWPVVDNFLRDLAPGSVGLDIGCGNGKYLVVRDDVYIVASDRSGELVKIAKQHEKHDALVGDALDPPHPPGRFDFAISIAVLHHLSTRERRIEGVRAVLQTLRTSRCSAENNITHEEVESHKSDDTPGQALFFVWALEQKGSRRGWEEGGEQDVLVPWVLKPPSESSKQSKSGNRAKKAAAKKTKEKAIEERDDCQNGTNRLGVDDSGVSNGNANQPGCDHDIPEKSPAEEQSKTEQLSEGQSPQVYQRYYHLYHQGELEEDILSAGGVIVKNGYDRDNWWCIAKKND